MIKHLFLDFGGCIDSPGIHTRTLFFREFAGRGLVPAADRAAFQDAYTAADRRMMQTGEARELALEDFNRFQARLIREALGATDSDAWLGAADAVSEAQARWILHASRVLREMANDWPISLISNFTGNLEVILREFEIRDVFYSVTESFYVGFSKPDVRIFQVALAAQTHVPAECLYVGDNPKNDIAPASSLGMKSALIHAPGEKKECGADAYVTDLAELPRVIQSM
ncbi:MAG: HAD family hydrolase [Bdellovibrionales bacterium]|nr:HAD family hydrolase [Bdellovibrionales bacterium]